MGMMWKCGRSGARQGAELTMNEARNALLLAERAGAELDGGQGPRARHRIHQAGHALFQDLELD
jgi:hypothetical protein